MPIHTVSDPRSNPDDQIAYAAKILSRSKYKRIVFNAICFGKKSRKKVDEIVEKTQMLRKRVLEEARKLVNSKIVTQTKVNGQIAYEKDSFYCQNRARILYLAENKKKLAKLPTKVKPQITAKIETINIPKGIHKAEFITIDDIDSFKLARKIMRNMAKIKKITESNFKNGIRKLLGETRNFKDWGGEKNDLLSTNIKLKGQRKTVAFAFKGKGTTGILNIKKMGKNGDQIPRLFKSASQVFIIQYWNNIDETVIDLMKSLAISLSAIENKKIYYGIIDGLDSQRIIQAYPKYFEGC